MAFSPSSKIYRVKNSEGHIYEVPEHKIDEALARDERNLVVDDQEFAELEKNSPQQDLSDEVFVKEASGKGIFQIPRSKLKEAEMRGGKLIDEKDIPPLDEPDTNSKLAARSAKTLGSSILGGTADTISAIYNIPASIQNATSEMMKKNNPDYMGENDFIPASQQEALPLIPSAKDAINESIDDATGGYTKTKEGDSTQAAIDTVGSVLSPGGLAKAAAKVGQHGAAKVLGVLGTTNPIGLGAAGAAGYASAEASNAGYGTAASIGAGLGAGVGAGALGAAAKAMNVKVALATLTGNSPKNIDLKAVAGAEATGIPVTNTIVNESKGLALAEQVVSKSPIIGTRYAKKLEANDKAFADAVESSIAKVGEKIIDSDSPLDIGSMIKDTFEGVKQSVINEKNELYQSVNSLLPEGATITPKNLIAAIDSIRGNIKTLRPSADESFVLSYLNDLEKGIALGAKENRLIAPVPIDMLVGSKVSINDIINWDVNASGAKNQLKKIQHAIKEDLSAYGQQNPKWYKEFQEADGFYGKYLGDEALGSKTLQKKIFAQQDPEKIIGSLNTISDFKALGQSLGRDEAGQKFFESIKREKLVDLIMGKTINPQSESISYAGFSKAMENKQNLELIKYLAGDNYQELQNFNKYAKAAVRHNQRNPNPSGTASTKTILGAVGATFASTVAGGLVNGITGGVAPLAGLSTLGAGLSWLVNNKTALKWGIDAAKKQAAGDYKAVSTYSKRLENAMKKDLGDDFVRQFIAISNHETEE